VIHLLIQILFCGIILPIQVSAVEIPNGLLQEDLTEVTNILGHNTSTKFLSNPFPLGGYSGFEFGVSAEFINTADLSRLGTPGQAEQKTFQYSRISIGKGLYNNVDLFLHFVPFSNSDKLSEYGGLLKYNFFQAEHLPFTLSANLHSSTINIEDQFLNQSVGWDLMGGLNLKSFALYFGGGNIKSTSSFAKATLDAGVATNSNNMLTTKSSQAHSFVGLHVNFKRIFVVGQIDRYEEPVYSTKLGMRF